MKQEMQVKEDKNQIVEFPDGEFICESIKSMDFCRTKKEFEDEFKNLIWAMEDFIAFSKLDWKRIEQITKPEKDEPQFNFRFKLVPN